MVSDKFCPWINSAPEMLKYRVVQVSIITFMSIKWEDYFLLETTRVTSNYLWLDG